MDSEATFVTGQLLDAIHFAAHKHRDQRRKNLARTPYINHPLDLAHTLWFVGKVRDIKVLMAAILHDTIEDTETSWDELSGHFGKEVADIVLEVTDNTLLDRQERKRLQVEHAPHASTAAKLVKLADKISNIQDIKNDPPENWDQERQKAYFKWAKEVVDAIRGTHSGLEDRFDSIYREYFNQTHLANQL